ncbi:MAG: hypothetical protein ACJ74W_19460 [Pyrinomonadaceae bacterium]
MQTRELTPDVPAYRLAARQLIKQLRADDSEVAAAAAARFQQLRSFAAKTIAEILAARAQIRLKHALAVIAAEHGQPSWRALKAAVEPNVQAPRAAEVRPGREMYARGLDVLLNRWFARYEDARASREQQGGWLLPFDQQFFICEAEGIRVLGLDPDDPDWALIGWDWVQPQDPAAWLRLKQKRARGRASADIAARAR